MGGRGQGRMRETSLEVMAITQAGFGQHGSSGGGQILDVSEGALRGFAYR